MSTKVASNLDFQGSSKVIGLVDPSSAQDAATKAYVDSIATGQHGVLQSAIVASATNLALSGLQTISGHTLLANERVLLTGQTTSSQNGLWAAQSSTWTRPTDFASGASVSDATIFVDTGASIWGLIGAASVTIDTTAQTWSQIGGLTEYSWTSPLSQSGSTISVTTIPVTSGGTGSTSASGAASNLGVARKYAATIGDGSATSFTVTHSFNSLDIVVQVWEISSGELVLVDTVKTNSNTVTIGSFAFTPAANSYRVVVLGL